MSMGKAMKKYDLRAEDIAAGKYDAFDLIEPVWWAVSIYDGKEQYEADMAPFTAAQRGVFAVMWYDAEVGNGGHEQFFDNSTGIVWEDALAGFRLIGAEKCAAILERVIAKCGGSIPFSREERSGILEKLDEDIFGEDDDDYYEVNDEIRGLVEEYAKSHPQEFVFCGEVEVTE